MFALSVQSSLQVDKYHVYDCTIANSYPVNESNVIQSKGIKRNFTHTALNCQVH